MKTIVYIISTLKRTGPTNVLAGTALNLDKKLFKPAVITLSPEEDNQTSWKSELEQSGIEVHSLNLSRLEGFLTGGHALKQVLESLNPDIVHTHCFRSAVLSALYLKKYKRIATIHCDYEVDFALAYGKIKGFLMTQVFTWALATADKRVCCSKILADLLVRKHPKTEYQYVNNGVDTQKFAPVEDKTTLRRTLNLPEDKKIFIWAGAFIPIKDANTLAKAILNLKNEEVFFVFCGTGPLFNQTKNTLKNCKNVLFTGQVQNVQDYFKASDFYVSTSLSEGLPLAALEAQFCGLLPLLSDIPQHRYILPKSILNHCIYQTQEELSDHLTSITEDNFKFILAECNKNIKNFSAKVMSNKYKEIYDQCL